MKKLLLIIFLLFSYSISFADDAVADTEQGSSEKSAFGKCENYENDNSIDGIKTDLSDLDKLVAPAESNANDSGIAGNDGCKMLISGFKESKDAAINSSGLLRFASHIPKCHEAKGEQMKNTPEGCQKKISEKLIICKQEHAMAAINSFDEEPDEAMAWPIGGAQAGGGAQMAMMAPLLSCEKKDVYTVDFDSCKNAINVLNAANGAEMAAKVKWDSNMKSFTQKQQTALAQKETDIQNEAIKAQKAAFLYQAKLAGEKAVFYGGKASAITGAATLSWTTKSNVEDKCESGYEGCCFRAVSEYPKLYFRNKQARTTLYTLAAAATAEAAKAITEKKSLEDQAKLLQLRSDQFTNSTNLAGNDWSGSYCDSPQGKMDSRCANRGNGFSNGIGSLGGGDVSFGVASVDTGAASNSETFNPAEIKADINRRGSSDSTNPVNDFMDESKGGRIAGDLAPGRLKNKKGAGGGSAGAASASASGSNLASSGVKKQSDEDNEPVNKTYGNIGKYGKGKKGAKYSRVWKRRLNNKKKKKSSKDLFKSMFDKFKPARNLAQAKDVKGKFSNLFKDISRRYDIVEGENRLIQVK